MLSAMRYKTFTWPHNPRTYTITYARQTAVHKVPMGLYTMQDLGRTCRILKGEGEFYGPKAYDTFKQLATVFYDPGPGTLIHPIWQTSSAYFTALSLQQEPRKDYVSYSFTFQEGYGGYAAMKLVSETNGVSGQATGTASTQTKTAAATSPRYHTVCSGDTLWAIAQKYSVTLSALLALNPAISNPNLIFVGQKVRVA